MPNCPQWSAPEKDEQLPDIVAGLAECYRFIVSSCKRHYVLRHGDIKTYHGKIFRRVVPLDYYAGNYRCADPKKPCLAAEVHVSGIFGETYTRVPAAMEDFSAELLDWIVRTDTYLKHTISETEKAQAVAQLAAAAMGNFIRIHPFMNGNGRMARMLVNYIFKRYGYRMPFGQAQIRPPEAEYAQASAASMGAGADFNPLYVYLLRLVARAAAL